MKGREGGREIEREGGKEKGGVVGKEGRRERWREGVNNDQSGL